MKLKTEKQRADSLKRSIKLTNSSKTGELKDVGADQGKGHDLETVTAHTYLRPGSTVTTQTGCVGGESLTAGGLADKVPGGQQGKGTPGEKSTPSKGA